MAGYPYSSSVGYTAREGGPRPPVRRAPTPHVPRARTAAPKPYDPFAPLTQQQMNAQASTSIQSQIAPVLKQITDAINQRSQFGSQAITQYTKQLIGTLDPAAANVKQIYADAEASQQALDSSLQQSLSGGGNADAQALTAELAKAGQDTSSVAQVASAGQSAGDTRYALGSASLASLIAQGANARTYMAKLPGIEAAGGAQTLRDFQGQLNNDLQTQTGQIRSQVPGMIQSYLTDAQNREYQKALARASGLSAQNSAKQKAQSTAFDQWYKTASLNERQAYQNNVLKLRQQGLSLQQAKIQAQQQAAQQKAQAAQQKAAQKQQAVQGKAVQQRGKAFDTNRKQAYSKAQTLHNAGSASSLLGSTVDAKSAYQTLWAQYGKPLMRYTASNGRSKWGHQVDTMIRTALMTAGYAATELPPARF